MSAIEPGDVVVCVDAAPYRLLPARGKPWPHRLGLLLRVKSVAIDCNGTLCLQFTSGPEPISKPGYRSNRYRKLDAADDAFIVSIRKREPVTA